MKKFLANIILSICYMSLVQADDIKEFKLDVISLGDSALKYFTKNELKNSSEEFFYKNKTYKYYFINTNKFKPYDGIQVTVKPNDPNFIIYNLDGVTWINNFEECKIQMNDVSKEFEKISSSRGVVDKGKHPMDKTGNSNYERILYRFSNGYAEIICFDMSKKLEAQGKYDRFSVTLGFNEFRKFLTDVHYK